MFLCFLLSLILCFNCSSYSRAHNIESTLKSPPPKEPDFVNNKPTFVKIGDINKDTIVFKIYFSPFCDHCSLFLTSLFKSSFINKLIKKKKIGFLLLPVAFYQKLDKHAVELAASTGYKYFFKSLKIFLDPNFDGASLFYIKDVLVPEETPSFSKEIIEGIKKNLLTYKNFVKKKRNSNPKDFIHKEIVTNLLLSRIGDLKTFSDITFSQLFYLRRDEITSDKGELNVPTIFVWDKKKWIHWKYHVETDEIEKYLKKNFKDLL